MNSLAKGMSDMEMIEKVARAIDPDDWALAASYRKSAAFYTPGQLDEDGNDTHAIYMDGADKREARSLERARAALSAYNPDERLREALEAVRKVREGYASQMKFCDIEAMGYFREFVRRIDSALSPLPQGDD